MLRSMAKLHGWKARIGMVVSGCISRVQVTVLSLLDTFTIIMYKIIELTIINC